jgi:hypothetical protein
MLLARGASPVRHWLSRPSPSGGAGGDAAASFFSARSSFHAEVRGDGLVEGSGLSAIFALEVLRYNRDHGA